MKVYLRDNLNNEIYRIIDLKNVSVEEFQNGIYDAIKRFNEEEFEWTVDDVLEALPSCWEWEEDYICDSVFI